MTYRGSWKASSIQIIVIDDGSTDNTAQVALEHGADFVLRHRNNLGLSKAFISGIQLALALGADIIVNTDADHQYPGSEIQALIQPILAGSADLAIGDRQPQRNRNFRPSSVGWNPSAVQFHAKFPIPMLPMQLAVFGHIPVMLRFRFKSITHIRILWKPSCRLVRAA